MKNDTKQCQLSSTRNLTATDLGPAEDQSLRLLVVGDTHVGYRHRESTDKVKSARRLDARDSFRKVVKQAKSLDVDGVIHAGDIFDHGATGHDRSFVIEQIASELSDIPFYYVYGNHDVETSRLTVDGAIAADSNVKKLSRDAISIGPPATKAFGIDNSNDSFPGPSIREKTDTRSPQTSANILVTHDTPYPIRDDEGSLIHSKNGADFRDAINQSPIEIDLIISGHMHIGSQGVLENHGIPVIVTGSPAPISKGSPNKAQSTWILQISDSDLEVKRIPW